MILRIHCFQKLRNAEKVLCSRMNTDLILNTGIENIDVVYGGVRGTTLSSRHNMRHWQTIVDSGVALSLS